MTILGHQNNNNNNNFIQFNVRDDLGYFTSQKETIDNSDEYLLFIKNNVDSLIKSQGY